MHSSQNGPASFEELDLLARIEELENVDDQLSSLGSRISRRSVRGGVLAILVGLIALSALGAAIGGSVWGGLATLGGALLPEVLAGLYLFPIRPLVSRFLKRPRRRRQE